MPSSPFWYHDFKVYFDPPPMPVRDMDWHFEHDDYDGAPDAYDHRHGHGPSAADCCRQIAEMVAADDEDRARFDHETVDLSDDRDALASAGWVEEE